MDYFQKKWNLRIVALLHDQRGARFAVLKEALGVNADSLTRSLQSLIEQGWVQRNPGYGHPLRPEYLLTEQGQRVALCCVACEPLEVSIFDGSPRVKKGASISSVLARGLLEENRAAPGPSTRRCNCQMTLTASLVNLHP